jgi:hypothetical protein
LILRNWRQNLALVVCGLASLGLAGCGSMRTIYLDDGRAGYLITCKGLLNSWENCLLAAGNMCRTNGYDAIRTEEYDRTLLVACKTAGSK